MPRLHKFCTSILLAALPLAAAAPAVAEGASIEQWRGHSVIRISGEIHSGLSDQLAGIIDQADIWADGTRVLLLDSPGGSVDEAFRVSDVIQRSATRTVVPNGASCASACASIVFVAGQYRTVEPFGRLGQHSCSRSELPDQQCNDEIAAHAVQNGVSHGSIAAFVTYALPSEMIWFSREDVDGWGLSRYPGEEASGFQKSEPRVIRMLTGEMPAAQSAWRLDFHGDGYRAFVRTVSDAEREMQLNLFCYELLAGRLFLSMEINGDVGALNNAITSVTVATEDFSWSTERPLTLQNDPAVASVVMEIPRELIRPFLTSNDQLLFRVDLREPFQPIQATTYLAGSRANLIFAANNCSRADYDLDGSPIAPRE
ncbi:MAG: putative periplasmic protein [Rhodobacteraceae bacterium HLUCCA12]|nr:MAG: putative periplasmic protein [Rhodobacteraceae bacterium HLUCCA12]